MTGADRSLAAPLSRWRASPRRLAQLLIGLVVLWPWGFALGGTLGVGTLAFALAVGPAVAAVLRVAARGGL